VSPHVLLVEDNADDEALAMRALARCSPTLKVDVARDGREALSRLGLLDGEAAQPLPDLVLLDIKLPLVDGLDVLRRIRRCPSTEGLSVVVLTSSDEPSDIVSAQLLNASRFVRKPVDYHEYMRCMSDVMRDFVQVA
jgi:two-component system, response regulator